MSGPKFSILTPRRPSTRTASRSCVWLLVVFGGLSFAFAHPARARQQESGGQAPKDAAPVPAETAPETASDSEPPAEEEPLPSARRERVDARPGDEVIIVQTDGQRMEGVLLSRTEQEVGVRIAGVEVRISSSLIERVILLDSPEERYRQMRALIGDEDVQRLIMLADWLQKRRMYAEALHEVEHVLTVNPTDGAALRMQKVLQELVRLEENRQARNDGGGDGAADDPWAPEPSRRPTTAEFPLLREDQINLIKVYEVDTKSAPRLVIARPVIDRLLNEYADSPLIPSTREGREAFYRKRPAEVLDVMFRVRARNLYEHVEVLDQPRSMRLFRDNVHIAWLVNSCATTRCHGGTASGRLRLTNRRPSSDEAVYTNFLILERFLTKDGKKLINYAEPEKSVLLQMGLPREDSLYPHPVVEGWKPAFRSREARRFREAVEWIRAMYRPRPDYPIRYTPPGEAESDWIPGGQDSEPQPR